MMLKNFIERKSFMSYDLKTGGQIIGYIHLFFLTLNIFRLFYVLYEWGLSIWLDVAASVILIIVTVVWLYGIEKENLNFMIPDLLISIVCVCGLIIAFIWLPISEYIFVQSEFPNASVTLDELHTEQDEARKFFYGWWIIGFLAVIEWHFTCVKICLFKSMKDGSNASNQANGTTNIV